MSHGDGKEGQNRLHRSPARGLGRLERKAEEENGADTVQGVDYQDRGREFKRKKPGLEETRSKVAPGNAFEVGADMKGGKEPIN